MTAVRIAIHCLSPLHIGGGESQSGIEQALTRDRTTGHPFIAGSSLKGVLRDAARSAANGSPLANFDLIFGKTSPQGLAARGAVLFGDAHVLAFPVRSVVGTFAWVSAPELLRKWKSLNIAASIAGLPESAPRVDAESGVLFADAGSAVSVGGANGERRVILEEFALQGRHDATATLWAKHIADLSFPAVPEWAPMHAMFLNKFCIVHDDVMNYLLDFETQLDPRVRLDDKKHVQHFWHEESLPTETILASLSVISAPPAHRTPGLTQSIAADLSTLTNRPLQFGGNETVGRGIARATATQVAVV